MIFNLEKSVNQKIHLPKDLGIELYIKRDDLIHSEISGNKYRKLKYNIIEAQKLVHFPIISQQQLRLGKNLGLKQLELLEAMSCLIKLMKIQL